MNRAILAAAIMIGAAAINIPLGYRRQGSRKFSFAWYFYVHISIPVIIYARIKSGFGWSFIPFTLGSTVIGQILGGRLYRRRHPSEEEPPLE